MAPDGNVGLSWPKDDLTMIPYGVYINEDVFALEMQRIFHGPSWNYLGLEVEIPEPGDFVTTSVGTTPVVLNRGRDGSIHAFVNRCAHRGAQVVRETYGNTKVHTCIYHQWSYDHAGKLVGVPYRNGIHGNGGFPNDFEPSVHCLNKLRIEIFHGIVFGTFSEATPPLVEYMGTPLKERIEALCTRPIKVTGYQRQRVRGNWKLYIENVKDCYHGSLLHSFNSCFGMFRSTQRGSSVMGEHPYHSVLTTYGVAESELVGENLGAIATHKPKFELEDSSVVDVFREHTDGMVTTILTMFPCFVLAQIANHLGFRLIRPISPDEFELVWTNFEYVDDEPWQSEVRRKQGNLLGPAGYLAMEDAEALELAQQSIHGDQGAGHAFIEFGGRAFEDQDHLVTEVPIRGFWKGYCEIMGFATGDGTAASS